MLRAGAVPYVEGLSQVASLPAHFPLPRRASSQELLLFLQADGELADNPAWRSLVPLQVWGGRVWSGGG